MDASFHLIACDYSCDNWNGLCDHLGDVPWEVLPLLVNFVSGFRCCCCRSYRNNFLCLHQQNQFSESKVKAGQKLWQIPDSVLINKHKSAIPPLFNGSDMLSSVSDKVKLLAKNFSKNSYLDDLGIYLPVFPSGTNLRLHNISITPKMFKKVIRNLDS